MPLAGQVDSQSLVQKVTDRARLRLQEGGQDEGTLAAQLEDSLARSLPWHAACLEEVQDQQFLFEAYANSVIAIEKAHADCVSFLMEACRASLEFRAEGIMHPEARDTLIEAEMNRMAGMLSLPAPEADRSFKARLVTESLDRVRDVLAGELRTRTASLVRGFLELCVNLVDKEVVGLIEWAGPGACELFFWKRVLIQRRHGTTVQEGQRRVEAILGGTKIITARTEHASGEHEIRQARHEHHLQHARAVPLDDIRFPVPREFTSLLRAIPTWMRPAMRLVTGIQFRGTIQEVEVGKEAWTHARPLPAREEYRINIDPVLALGPLVLAGWDSDLQNLENQRLDHEARSQQAAAMEVVHSRVMTRATILFVLWQTAALAVAGMGAAGGSGLLWVGVGMATAGIAAVIELARYDAAVRPSASAKATFFAVLATTSCVASFHFLTVALCQRSVEHFFIGLGLLISVWILGAEFKKAGSSR